MRVKREEAWKSGTRLRLVIGFIELAMSCKAGFGDITRDSDGKWMMMSSSGFRVLRMISKSDLRKKLGIGPGDEWVKLVEIIGIRANSGESNALFSLFVSPFSQPFVLFTFSHPAPLSRFRLVYCNVRHVTASIALFFVSFALSIVTALTEPRFLKGVL
ncbi:unnamed protein product [Sphenostylis stenocarpa]|uniref:Uncharacterized protein n=1 Tax=Sphenostylis stenocarpa TaxID=92480 RepID=A0AA86T3R5_9FABA|nr:unnamed protein product [Sphenostylis stenocarpa]